MCLINFKPYDIYIQYVDMPIHRMLLIGDSKFQLEKLNTKLTIFNLLDFRYYILPFN